MDAMRNPVTGEFEYDVVVIGGGAAGLNGALLLARSRRSVAVVDAGEPRNAPAAEMHGLLSRDGTPPAELLELARAELTGYGVTLINARVERINPSVDAAVGFHVRVAGGPVLTTRRVLVATGLRDDLPDLPGVRERWGKDALHCPYCHGYEVRDRPLGVLGTDPRAVHLATMLPQWSPDVVLFRHTLELTAEDERRLAARGVTVVDGELRGLVVRDDRLAAVATAEVGSAEVGSAKVRETPREAVFVPAPMLPNDAVLDGLGCERDPDGRVITDPTGRTRTPGIWVAGNVADSAATVVAAAAQGAMAGAMINFDLIEEDTTQALNAVPSPAA